MVELDRMPSPQSSPSSFQVDDPYAQLSQAIKDEDAVWTQRPHHHAPHSSATAVGGGGVGGAEVTGMPRLSTPSSPCLSSVSSLSTFGTATGDSTPASEHAPSVAHLPWHTLDRRSSWSRRSSARSSVFGTASSHYPSLPRFRTTTSQHTASPHHHGAAAVRHAATPTSDSASATSAAAGGTPPHHAAIPRFTHRIAAWLQKHTQASPARDDSVEAPAAAQDRLHRSRRRRGHGAALPHDAASQTADSSTTTTSLSSSTSPAGSRSGSGSGASGLGGSGSAGVGSAISPESTAKARPLSSHGAFPAGLPISGPIAIRPITAAMPLGYTSPELAPDVDRERTPRSAVLVGGWSRRARRHDLAEGLLGRGPPLSPSERARQVARQMACEPEAPMSPLPLSATGHALA
ncbi:hypothetical protein CXG81DRAFT_17167 [Caulochytrium protostelioides]|uniref:Uncharacterized protein n=1 Tax=Caulochytrium protostelioides TaxID=1555241 RepID=A0A4P9XCY3_9FUNG|nr:hypothetical protein CAUPRSCDRAFT_10446 [Caulochytrium protostelioides]RKP03318.1 hypothetical protein CXG81DRAFT_17167 [Caulochytrium protostelioides]|eukprot:RKP03318.1 hypothetical protein CXG81DRAFT_17167 [Caulochytrium protostelioides]